MLFLSSLLIVFNHSQWNMGRPFQLSLMDADLLLDYSEGYYYENIWK
jgi:hypothetical protein